LHVRCFFFFSFFFFFFSRTAKGSELTS
jgi:hypothetical protein